MLSREAMNSLWQQLASAGGIEWDEERDRLCGKLLDLMLEANRTMNLTRITDRAQAEVLHVGDALCALPYLPREPHALADVGSGGGVPGLPLAIARPDVSVTLVESVRKRATYLERTVEALRLDNVRVATERSETLARSRRGAYEVVTVRAVGSLEEVVRTCWPMLAPSGRLLAWKGARAQEELAAAGKALASARAKPPVVHVTNLPGAEHHVIVEIRRG
jgi:16S rRNA (guanine527-N7)-methyltransferase